MDGAVLREVLGRLVAGVEAAVSLVGYLVQWRRSVEAASVDYSGRDSRLVPRLLLVLVKKRRIP